jgi:hypothetical protein
MKVDKLKEMIRNLIEEIEDEEEMDEATTTGAVDGYKTPHAFSSKDGERKKNKRMADIVGYTQVNEATNRYHQLRKEEGTPNQKIGKGIREMRKQLQEIEKFIEWYSKIKNENDLDSSQYWKRTQRHLGVMREKLNKISQKIQNLTA